MLLVLLVLNGMLAVLMAVGRANRRQLSVLIHRKARDRALGRLPGRGVVHRSWKEGQLSVRTPNLMLLLLLLLLLCVDLADLSRERKALEVGRVASLGAR